MTRSGIRYWVAAMSTAAVVTGAALATTAAAGTHSPVYTHTDTGRTVHLAVGTVFTVKLKTCADCGDAWSWVHRPHHQVVTLLSKRVVSNVKAPAVGGIAHTVYRFKVVGTGQTREVLKETGPSGTTISHFRLTEIGTAPEMTTG